MSNTKVDNFIKSGEFKGLRLGQNTSELDQNNLIPSNCEDDNGKLCDYIIDGVRVNMIVKENIINMIMIKLGFWNEELTFSFSNQDLNKITISEFLKTADELNLRWEFKSCALRVLVGKFIDSGVEFIYDCNVYDDNEDYFFYAFQVGV